MANLSQMHPMQAIAALLVAAALIWFFFGGGLERQTAATMEQIKSADGSNDDSRASLGLG